MAENKLSEIIKASLEGVKGFTDVEAVIGNAINTTSGVTIIPISKINVGFATGGLDYGGKKLGATQNFGGGGGTGVSITPVGFLTVNKNEEVNLIPVKSDVTAEKVISLIEQAPDLIERIKNALT